MAAAPGTRLGVYEVVALLGTGGMGEVYRARDTKLNRDVAIKVLPEALAADSDRLTRFRREAQVLASLNHPNIAAIHGFEDSPSMDSAAAPRHALVMELVEGPTLAEVIARDALAIDRALSIARQIAEAIEAAHERGIIHRDLKPANIKVRDDGTVKVLDFGLAKALDTGSEDPAYALSRFAPPSQAPTIASPDLLTSAGIIVGTPAYMSPEQARGETVDKRTDIWSFGCVLYEMITGRRAFGDRGSADARSHLLQQEPDPATPSETARPNTMPPVVRRLLLRCLETDRNKRLSHIAAASFQIEEALAGLSSGSGRAIPPASSTRRIRLIAPALVAGACVGAASLWLFALRPPDEAAPVTRLQMRVTPADELGGAAGRPTRTAFALSPDGRTLVFSAVVKNQRALYARPFDQPSAMVVTGTEGAVAPFLSPDGQWVGYWSAAEIRKAPLRGGAPVLVVAASQIFGATWGDDDQIVFGRGTGGLLEVPASGGSPRELTTLNVERGEVSHRLPYVLPGSDAVLFTVTHNRFPRWDETQVWVHSRSTGVSRLLIEGGADARYVSSGHLVYAREGVMLAVPFDPTRLEVTGGPVGVVPDVMQAAYVSGQPNDSGAMQVSVSSTGTLVYVAGGTQPDAEFSVLQLDRTGRGDPLPIPPQDFRTVRMSPDGTRLALSTGGRDRGTWVYEFARGTLSRLAAAGRSSTPVWTPNGDRITYAMATKGPNNLYWIRADGSGAPERLVESTRNFEAGGWAPNGRDLLYYEIPSDALVFGQAGPNVWAQDLIGKDQPRQIAGPFATMGGIDVSPDGRWVAYHSGEGGRLEVYVDAYPGPGPRVQVSTSGGGSPIWRTDGRELFYAQARVSGRRGAGPVIGSVEIMAVEVTTEPTLRFGTPRQLFAGRYSMNAPARAYDVSGDGQRFLFLQARERSPDVISEVSVVQNWTEELKRLVPAK